MSDRPRTMFLATPPVPLVVDAAVFDAFGWQASTLLEWRTRTHPIELNRLDGDPLHLAFVLRAPWDAVPTELARLHAGRGYGLTDELALAPYGVDDATDQLFAHRRAACETFWLAADNSNALFWGLHDWVHFHNHGAFDERAATELQCDLSALAWLWINRAHVPIDERTWDELRADVKRAHEARCRKDPPRVTLDARLLDDARRLRDFADALDAGTGLETTPSA